MRYEPSQRLLRPAALRRAKPDIAALMQAEGTAMRPGPRPALNSALLTTLRQAILAMQLVSVRYARDGEAARATLILTAAAIKLVWVAEWVAGAPVGKTRVSRFSALQLVA